MNELYSLNKEKKCKYFTFLKQTLNDYWLH